VSLRKARGGDLDGAIELSRAVIEEVFAPAARLNVVGPTIVLAEALLRRCADTDLQEAQAAIDRPTAVPTEPDYITHDFWPLRLRAPLARVQGDDAKYRDYRDRYRAMATSLGFERHIKWAEAMP
jgi:adenylate cyclase